MKSFEYIAEPTETGFSAFLPEVDGVASTGRTLEDLDENLREAIAVHLDLSLEEPLELYRVPVVTASVEVFKSAALRSHVELSSRATAGIVFIARPEPTSSGGAIAFT